MLFGIAQNDTLTKLDAQVVGDVSDRAGCKREVG